MSLPPTRFFYSGSPQAIVSVHPTPEGIGLSITWPCEDDKPGAWCLMRPEWFQELIDAAPAILEAAEQERNRTNQHALFTDQEGTNR